MLTIFIAILRGTVQPLNIFNDPNAIGLMGVGVGIAAIIVAILVGIYQIRQRRTWRRLGYHYLSNGPVVTINSTVANQVEIDIRVKGISVKDAHLIVLLIKNSGKVSIHATDYFEPLTFEFDTKVLSASVLEPTPPTLINSKDISAFLTLTPQSVQFPAFPLNPNDAVQINILLEGKGTMKVRGRLDQGSIAPFEPKKGIGAAGVFLAIASFIAGTILAESLALLAGPALSEAATLLAVELAVATGVTLYLSRRG